MRAKRIIEAALCADQLLNPSAHPKKGYVLLAALNLTPFLFFFETASKDEWPVYAFFMAGYALHLAAHRIGKLAGGVQSDVAQERWDALGQAVAHLGNALILFGAGDLAAQRFDDIGHFPPLQDLDYANTSVMAAAALCCVRRVVLTARAAKTQIGRYVNGYSSIPG